MDHTQRTLTKAGVDVLEYIHVMGIVTIRDATDAKLGSYRNLQRVFATLVKQGLIKDVCEDGDKTKSYTVVVVQ